MSKPKKMTDEQVAEAMVLLRAGAKCTDVARRYGVTPSLISRLRSGTANQVAARPLGKLNDHRSKPAPRQFAFDGKVWRVARLAWTLRHGPIPNGMNVCHTCDNPPCTRDSHHFLGTQLDNIKDMMTKGRQRGAVGDANGSRKYPDRRPRGSRVAISVLTERQVKRILNLYANGCRQIDLVRQFQLNKQTVFAIVHRRTWRHVIP